jgi:hypothetical protein
MLLTGLFAKINQYLSFLYPCRFYWYYWSDRRWDQRAIFVYLQLLCTYHKINLPKVLLINKNSINLTTLLIRCVYFFHPTFPQFYQAFTMPIIHFHYIYWAFCYVNHRSFFAYVSYFYQAIITFFSFAPITQSVYLTLKRVSKRSSFRYAFQEHLLKFLMLAVIHSEMLLRAHCISRHFKFKIYNCSSIYQRYVLNYF